MGDFLFTEDGRAVRSGVTSSVHDLNDIQKKARSIVLDSFETARNGKEDWIEEASKWYDSYHQQLKDAVEEEEGERKARISTPDAFSHVEGILAKQRAAIFPANLNEDIIRLIPGGLQYVDFIKPNEVLLNYQLRRMDIRGDNGTIWLRNYLMFGIAPAFPYWRSESRTVPYRPPIQIQNPITGQLITIGYGPPEKRKVPFFDGPDLELCDVEDWFPDPAAKSFRPQDMRFAMQRKYISWQRLKLHAEMGRYDKKMFDLIRRDQIPPARDDFGFNRRSVFRRRDPHDFSMPKGAKGIVELINFYNREWIITVANREIPLRAVKNPYYLGEMPVLCPTRLRHSNEPWGKSIMEPIVPIHNIINALINLRLDNLRIAVQKMWTVLQGSIDKSKLKSSTRILEVMDHDDIKEREFKDVTSQVFNEVAAQMGMMEKATGLNSAATADAANIRSGIQQIAVAEITGERNQMDIDAFVHGGLIPLARTCHVFNQQFITDDILVPVVGPDYSTDFMMVSVDALHGEYEFIINAAAKSIPTAVEARQKLELVNSLVATLSQFPDMLVMLYKQIAQDSHYSELAKVLDVIAGLVSQVRERQGGVVPVGGPANQINQGGNGIAGAGGSPSSDLSALMSSIDNDFGSIS